MSALQEVATDDLLSFQDFPQTFHSPNGDNTPFFATQEPEKKDRNQEPDKAITEDENEGSSDVKSFWTLEYYQRYFDVETRDVLERLFGSVAVFRPNGLNRVVFSKPDLYGPIWVSITLIFTIAISGNIANYLQHTDNYRWKYDFHLVSYAATAIVTYVALIPIVLWSLLKSTSDNLEIPSPLSLVSIYGYSIFVYVPVSVLWTIQISALQWLLVAGAACVSGVVLVGTLWPSLRASRRKLGLVLGVVGCHLGLAAGFMLYFFHVPKGVVVDGLVGNKTSVGSS